MKQCFKWKCFRVSNKCHGGSETKGLKGSINKSCPSWWTIKKMERNFESGGVLVPRHVENGWKDRTSRKDRLMGKKGGYGDKESLSLVNSVMSSWPFLLDDGFRPWLCSRVSYFFSSFTLQNRLLIAFSERSVPHQYKIKRIFRYLVQAKILSQGIGPLDGELISRAFDSSKG